MAENAETISNKLHTLAMQHISSWSKVASAKDAENATKVTKKTQKSIRVLISVLKKHPRPTAKERSLLTSLSEKNLNSLNQQWDSVDQQLSKKPSIYPLYQKANQAFEAELDKHMPTLYKWIGSDQIVASE